MMVQPVKRNRIGDRRAEERLVVQYNLLPSPIPTSTTLVLFYHAASLLSFLVHIIMADDPPQRHPASPITLLLQTLGMTRDDLSRHSTQMRNILEAESEGFQPVAYKTELAEGLLVERNGVRSRTQSLTNLSLAGPSSYAASPPRTPVKAEPVERGIPSRPKDTMEMVMERKSKEKRRARKGE